MPRELEYRVWDKESKRMITREQSFIPLKVCSLGVLKLSPHHPENLWEIVPVERFEIMQYTGFKDNVGIKIFDGDIVEFDRDEWGDDGNIHQITWDNDNGCWDWGGGLAEDMMFRKVIGNIYENYNLLKQNHV